VSATAGYPAEGEEIGPYRVLRRIGGGGMGAVFEALDVALGRRVALKVIAPDLSHDGEFRARFTAEARALAALDSGAEDRSLGDAVGHGGCLFLRDQGLREE